MDTIEYKNLEWYIINETDKEKLLFLKDAFTNEQIAKYFIDKSMVDYDYNIKFSKDNSLWFKDSYIREVLNSLFLSDLEVRDLNLMSTTVSLNGEFVTTEDYVRLITKEEVEFLPKEILKTERKYGYWTMTPWGFYIGKAYVVYVYGSTNPGNLYSSNVHNASSVRPVISLKSEGLLSLEKEEEKRKREKMIKLKKRLGH